MVQGSPPWYGSGLLIVVFIYPGLWLGLFGASAWFGQNFQIKGFELLGLGLINGFINGGDMNNLAPFLIRAEPAVKIPKIVVYWQLFIPFSLYIFFNFKFDGLNKPWPFDLWVAQRKRFLHNDSKRLD